MIYVIVNLVGFNRLRGLSKRSGSIVGRGISIEEVGLLANEREIDDEHHGE